MACIDIVGPSEIGKYFSYEYEVFIDNTYNKDITIFLSYGGGNLIRNTDFTAPDRVIIQAGSLSAIFILSTNTECRNNRYIKIESTSNDIVEMCSDMISNLVCDEEIDFFCDKLFFFEPYGHKTKKPNNMR